MSKARCNYRYLDFHGSQVECPSNLPFHCEECNKRRCSTHLIKEEMGHASNRNCERSIHRRRYCFECGVIEFSNKHFTV